MLRYIPATLIRQSDGARFVNHDDRGYVLEEALKQYPNSNHIHLPYDSMFFDHVVLYVPYEKDGKVIDAQKVTQEDLQALMSLADKTKVQLEKAFSRRGWTTGKKKWEQELLYLAYEGLGTKPEDRKFGLDKITDPTKIRRGYCW